MQKINSYISIYESMRLLDFVLQYVNEFSTRNGAKKAIKKGLIKINNSDAFTGDYVNTNDVIDIYEDEPSQAKIFEQKLTIHYEDDYLAIVFKPAGIGVSGNYFRTIQNALTYNLKPSLAPDKLHTPRPIHRLDNPTSGLLVISKTSEATIKLGEMLANKQLVKFYHAIVMGEPKYEGSIKSEIDDKHAHSEFQTIKTTNNPRLGKISLIKLSPITGRTHQLRIHMAEIGHPILGDKNYGSEASNKLGKGLFLCATELSFLHPFLNENIHIKADLPNKFLKIIP